jgi:hypothetical protein
MTNRIRAKTSYFHKAPIEKLLHQERQSALNPKRHARQACTVAQIHDAAISVPSKRREKYLIYCSQSSLSLLWHIHFPDSDYQN